MSYASEVLADAPVAWYRMQEASGLIQDSSGNALHSTASIRTVTYQQASPILSEPTDKSILFSSAGQRFDIPHNALLNVGDVFSIEAWVRRTTSGILLSECIVNKESGTFGLQIAGTEESPTPVDTVLVTKPGTGDIGRSSTTITDTKWHHIVWTKSAGTNHLYVDGIDVFVSIGAQTCGNNANIMEIGLRSGGTSSDDPCVSYLDEVAIYGKELSEARVLAHYRAGIPLYLLYWTRSKARRGRRYTTLAK